MAIDYQSQFNILNGKREQKSAAAEDNFSATNKKRLVMYCKKIKVLVRYAIFV